MQLQHNLSIQQQELIQQLQLVQRQYLIHQGLVKPLHLDFQAQFQTVLPPTPARMMPEKDHFADHNLRVSEKQTDLDALYTVGHHQNNNNNNNNNNDNNNSYCNVKNNNKSISTPMKEEIQTEDSHNPIKVEYAVDNYNESNVSNATILPSCSSENTVRTGDDLAPDDEEMEDEDEADKAAEHIATKSERNTGNKNFQPPWPTRMDTIGRSSAFSSDDNDDNNNMSSSAVAGEPNDIDSEKRGNSRIYVNSGNSRLSKRRVSSSASMSPPRHQRLRSFLSPTDALGIVPPISFYGIMGQPYRLDDILSPNEGMPGTNNNHQQQSDHEIGASKQYFHPLFVHGVCRWPGCELALDDATDFVKHLNTEHSLDDRSTAQARVQMQVVSQLEIHLQKERDRLQAMMHHLYLTKQQFVASCSKQEPNISNTTTSSVTTSPHSSSSQQNVTDNGTIRAMQTPIMNSNISAMRKRISDKSPLSLAGGLPYMLERAGLDVQQEIQRNREFYKNADVRPPFTYASLIRQSIIESPDKQLTLNEIYNWFQNTFCYFRRNAATWKNAIRTNLSLHKCFVRYEDDFGSFWMVDDSEFVKRRHLSRGRPRKYEPSSSPNSNSNSQHNSRSTSNSSSQKIANASVDESFHVKSNIKNSSGAGNGDGDNDGFDICAGSQRNSSNNNNNKHTKANQQIGKTSLSQPNSNAELGISPNLIDGYYHQATFHQQQQTQNLAHESNGNFSPNLQNIWPCSPTSFDDAAASAAAAALNFGSTYRHHYRHHENFRQQLQQQQQNSQRISQHDFRLFQQQQISHHQPFSQHQRQHLSASNCNDSFSNMAPTYVADKPCSNMAFKLEQQQYQRLAATSNANERLQHPPFYSSKAPHSDGTAKTSPEDLRCTLDEHQDDQRNEDDANNKIFKQPARNLTEILDNEVKK